jgi:hypothetical protein
MDKNREATSMSVKYNPAEKNDITTSVTILKESKTEVS